MPRAVALPLASWAVIVMVPVMPALMRLGTAVIAYEATGVALTVTEMSWVSLPSLSWRSP